MSIVLASRLSPSDLLRLGNNLPPHQRNSPFGRRRYQLRRRLVQRRLIATLNRSLACVDEQIDSFLPGGPRPTAA